MEKKIEKYWAENHNGTTCGHAHKTAEAAEKCRQKLLCWNRKEKTCSAAWYNSRVRDNRSELYCGN